MAFVTRYDDDLTRPGAKGALRDLAVRAMLPAMGLWLVIVGVGWLIVRGPLMTLGTSEEQVNDTLAAGRTATWTAISHWWSLIGNTQVIVGVCLVVTAILWFSTKRWWFAVVPVVAITLQMIVFVSASWVVGRDRPPVEKLDDSPPTASFPSGHVSATTALYVTIMLVVLRISNPVVRRVGIAVCVLVPFLVGYARLYRGMHHVTDVMFGVVNGLMCALLAWGYLRRERPARGDQTRA